METTNNLPVEIQSKIDVGQDNISVNLCLSEYGYIRVGVTNGVQLWRRADKERERRQKYYEDNIEHYREKQRKYRDSHLEQCIDNSRKWYKENAEKVRGSKRKYRVDNLELCRERDRDRRKTPAGKAKAKRTRYKRRQLGFSPINEWFEGSEAHHINQNTVIHIPKALHRSIYHSQHTGQGMQEINTLAWKYFVDVELSVYRSKR